MGCNNSTEQVDSQAQIPVCPHQINPKNNIEFTKPSQEGEAQMKPQSDALKAEQEGKVLKQNPTGETLPEKKVRRKSEILEEELCKHVSELFDKYDTNKRGTLNMIQFGKFLKENMGTDLTNQQVKDYLKITDTSGDKKIDKKELITLYRTLVKY